MISIKQALSIRDGDTVYDYYGRHLEVKNYFVVYKNSEPTSIEFNCRDINTNEQARYTYDEIYTDINDLSDEDILFLKWLKKNTNCYCYSDEIKLLKQAFMNGFSNGYSYKQQKLAEAQLQK